MEVEFAAIEKDADTVISKVSKTSCIGFNGKKIFVLAEGRLVNLSCAEGHPASVMDMSFANQALSVEYILKNYKKLSQDVHILPEVLDVKIAELKLKSLGIKIDTLTPRQKEYLTGWREGTI